VRQEIRLAGFGGQGVILAGYILGKAAALYDAKEAVLTQSYGPEARGGACAAEVVVSEEPIDHPLFEDADLLVALSLEAFTKYRQSVKPGATLVLDADLVQAEGLEGKVHRAPFTKIAEGLGNKMAANVVMLGFLCGLGVVSTEAMEESIRTSVRPRFVDLNLKAFKEGYELAREPEAVR
jgi:2-oxoglutarate ferredoxin oxidoreductase subunit gamma